MTEKQKARAAVLLGNFFFGTSVIAVKHISPILMPALAMTTIRVGVVCCLFWAMYVLRPQKMGIVKKDYGRLLLCGIAGIACNQTFSIKGMSLTSPIHASLLILTTPIAISLLAAWFLKETLNAVKIFGLCLGVAGGIVLVFSRDLSAIANSDQMLGDMFVMMGAISYSIYIILVKPLMTKYKAGHILQWIFLFGAIVTIPLGWSSLAIIQWHDFDFLSWFCLFYVVIGATFIAYQLMNYGINQLGASATGAFIYTQPFFATIASAIILHETINFPKILAAILIMAGVFLTNFKKSTGSVMPK